MPAVRSLNHHNRDELLWPRHDDVWIVSYPKSGQLRPVSQRVPLLQEIVAYLIAPQVKPGLDFCLAI